MHDNHQEIIPYHKLVNHNLIFNNVIIKNPFQAFTAKYIYIFKCGIRYH